MKEKIFVDTNIFVYLKLRDEKNRDKKSASALENGCKILYSEDMHHNHLIEKKLRIIFPFITD